jgi:hypothetical protein
MKRLLVEGEESFEGWRWILGFVLGIWAHLGLLDSFVYKQRNRRFDREYGICFSFLFFLVL